MPYQQTSSGLSGKYFVMKCNHKGTQDDVPKATIIYQRLFCDALGHCENYFR